MTGVRHRFDAVWRRLMPRVVSPSPLRLSARGLLLALLLIGGCDRGPSDLPASERPLPADSPALQQRGERGIPLQGAYNFRDLGGYPAADGRTTRWGLLYRSGELSELTAEDRNYLQRLKLATVVDFRSQQEITDAPDRLGEGTQRPRLQILPIDVAGANMQGLEDKIVSGEITAGEARGYMVEANRAFVESFTPVYSRWLHSLLEPNALPMVFHCSAGKDRTGFAAAVLLLTLGVDRDRVMQDYLASNHYNADYIQKMARLIRWASLFQVEQASVEPLFVVRRDYIEAAFRQIDRDYGSFTAYLREGLGISREEQQQLVRRLTE